MGSWLTDPGPCPVDDTPHTACTPESVAAGRYRAKLDPTVTIPLAPPLSFTTATYRRDVHGPAAVAARAAASSSPRAGSACPPPASTTIPAARATRPSPTAPAAPGRARARGKGKP